MIVHFDVTIMIVLFNLNLPLLGKKKGKLALPGLKVKKTDPDPSNSKHRLAEVSKKLPFCFCNWIACHGMPKPYLSSKQNLIGIHNKRSNSRAKTLHH